MWQRRKMPSMDDAEVFTGWSLAEINIARAVAPLADPAMSAFVAQLDAINRLAEASDGFIWRLKDEAGGPSSYVKFSDDDRVIVNLSVWRSVASLKAYVYRSAHGTVYRDRRQWFEPMTTPSLALWWVEAGHVPSLDEGRRRLEMLGRDGPTPQTFTIKQWFAPDLGRASGRASMVP